MKLVASLIATAALGLSMLVLVPSTATAAPPYPGTVRTTTNYRVPAAVKKKKKLVVRYRVKAAGNAHPRGIVNLRVYKFKNGKRKMIRLVSRRYVGPQVDPRLARQVQEAWPLLHEGPVPPQQRVDLQAQQQRLPELPREAR